MKYRHQSFPWFEVGLATAVGGAIGYALGKQQSTAPAGAAMLLQMPASTGSNLLSSPSSLAAKYAPKLAGTRGPINPFVLAQIAAGQPIDWRKTPKPEQVVERLLKTSFVSLLSPQNSLMYPLPQNVSALDQIGSLARHREWNPPKPPADRFFNSGMCSWAIAGEFASRGIDAFDANQGDIPNCHFVASLQALAFVNPSALNARVVRLADGRRQFTLYDGDSWRTVVVTERVPVFTPSGRSYSLGFGAGSGGVDASPVVGTQVGWPGVFEKAFAVAGLGVSHDMPNLLLPSYWVPHEFDADGLPSGSPVPPFTAITGMPTAQVNFAHAPTAEIWRYFHAMCSTEGVMTVPAHISTIAVGPSGAEWAARKLVPQHAYSVLGSIYRDGRNYLVLRNAWGQFGPDGDGTLIGTFAGHTLGESGLFALEASIAGHWFDTGHHVGGI